jgi:ribosomal-protein-alanine N-acetyltransferase
MIWWPSEIPTLQYGRVTLRPPAESDVEQIFEACQDPLIPRFTTVPAEYTMAHALDYVQRVPASLELHREFPFVIEFGVGDDKEFAGVVSLHTITNYGFLTMGFRRIEAAVDVDNSASQKLLMSAGYTKEGILRQRVTRSDGRQIDMVELAVLASEWEELK